MAQIDRQTLGTWFEQYAPRLVLYARQWLDYQAAQDAVQDAFVQLIGQNHEPANVKAWLFKTVRYRSISRLRSRARRRKREQVVSGNKSWFEYRSDQLLDINAVTVMLEALDPNLREIIVLRIWGQLTLQQVGDIVGLSVATIFRRYEQGLQTIRNILEQSCKSKISNNTD